MWSLARNICDTIFRGKILLATSEQFEVKNSNVCERVMIDVPWLEMAHNHDSSLFLDGKKVISDGKRTLFPRKERKLLFYSLN